MQPPVPSPHPLSPVPCPLSHTGLVADGDAKKFRLYREVEIKHGRVAMAAVLGYLIQELARFPGAIDLDGTSFEAIPNGVGAIGAIPSLGWLQIVFSVGYWDLVVWEDQRGEGAGDFGTGYFGKSLKGEEKTEKLTKEIQNGRLAMLGIVELLTHDIARSSGEGLFVLHHF
jgi:light-harvesting complex I chlorophyll a/b binding protein 1